MPSFAWRTSPPASPIFLSHCLTRHTGHSQATSDCFKSLSRNQTPASVATNGRNGRGDGCYRFVVQICRNRPFKF